MSESNLPSENIKEIKLIGLENEYRFYVAKDDDGYDRYYIEFFITSEDNIRESCRVEITRAVFNVYYESSLLYMVQEIERRRHISLFPYTSDVENSAGLCIASSEEKYELQNYIELIKEALGILTPTELRRVKKHFLSGMSYSRIAFEEGITKISVGKSIRNAVAKLNKYITKSDD